MNKSYDSGVCTLGVSRDELAMINQYTLKELREDEVFAFSMILCDNEIDRDAERFDDAALEKLKELFLGVTGVFDHVHSGKNQTARIFYTEVVRDEKRLTSYGSVYQALRAKAYLPRTAGNAELIENISAGILKEVSVCCSVGGYICSVCGEDLRSEACSHIKGAEYDGQLCHCVLTNPKDAYEWSFVAVPAQPGAGVTKGLAKRKITKTLAECEASLKAGREVVIDAKLAKTFGKKLQRLEKDAALGKAYRSDLTAQTVRFAALVMQDADAQLIEKMCAALDIDELKAFRQTLAQKAEAFVPLQPQLFRSKEKDTEETYQEFKF